MVILSFLALALLLGVANPLSAPIFQRPDSTQNKHYTDRQRGTPTALPGTDSKHSVTTG